MLEAMHQAAVGDDVFGEDPTINQLEARMAGLFGKEAGLFCSSGTMTNQVAIKVHTRPGDEVVCHRESHIYQYEGGGIAFNAGCSVHLIDGNRGRIDPDLLPGAMNNPDDVHKARTSLVSIEDTANRGGGAVYRVEDIARISSFCTDHNLPLHLDGARVFNALAVNGMEPLAYGNHFNSISVCLSKGLGCPVGSVLVGDAEFIRQGRRVRKVFGGGMRQAGYLAAAGLYALDHHVERLKEDHQHALVIADTLRQQQWVNEIFPVETNIVVVQVQGLTEQDVCAKLRDNGVFAMPFGKQLVRFVTHLDITPAQVDFTCQVISKLA
jgi:threonine aldolase